METKTATYCNMTEQRFTLKPGTKTSWLIEKPTTTENYTEQQYHNCVEAAPFFRRLGGSEHLDYGYFSKGYLCYRIISKSPDRQTKVIRTFNFD